MHLPYAKPEEIRFNPDIVCHKTGEQIPMDKFSYSKWSDKLALVYCPSCKTWHQFDILGTKS